MNGEEAFRAWFIQEHWSEVRWFSLGIENDGDAPASGIHIRLKPPKWLRFFKERPIYKGPRFPERPNLSRFTSLQSMSASLFGQAVAGESVITAMSRAITPRSLREKPFELTLEGGEIIARGKSLAHKHKSKPLGDLAAVVLPGHPAGEVTLDYSIFWLEAPDWKKGELVIRVIPPVSIDDDAPTPAEEIEFLESAHDEVPG
jgi:hypothetical protein